MKTIHATIIFIFLVFHFCSGQEFVTSIIFEDSIGNRDTLEVGYDSLATINIDTAFGEVNIIQIPRDSFFDIRFSDVGWSSTPTFHTKRQIVSSPCIPGFVNILSIDIKAQYWPVKAYWSQDFQNDCVDSSLITNVPPGGWWDAFCYPAPIVVKRINTFPSEVEFYPSEVSIFSDYCGYIDGNDTIQVIYLVLSDAIDFLTVSINQKKKENVKIYPIPFSEILNIDKSDKIKSIRVLDIFGKEKFFASDYNEKLNLGFLENGLYIIEINFSGNTIIKKIIKNNR
jgi:hypothetical protein